MQAVKLSFEASPFELVIAKGLVVAAANLLPIAGVSAACLLAVIIGIQYIAPFHHKFKWVVVNVILFIAKPIGEARGLFFIAKPEVAHQRCWYLNAICAIIAVITTTH